MLGMLEVPRSIFNLLKLNGINQNEKNYISGIYEIPSLISENQSNMGPDITHNDGTF